MSDPLLDGPESSAPILTADFAKGEQFWKFWMTGKVELSSGEIVRLKILSKRTKEHRFAMVAMTERENGNKVVWAEGSLDSDPELMGFVQGVQAAMTHMVGLDNTWEMVDFTACDTYDRWNYKFREGTTVKLWKSEDGSSVKGNM